MAGRDREVSCVYCKYMFDKIILPKSQYETARSQYGSQYIE